MTIRTIEEQRELNSEKKDSEGEMAKTATVAKWWSSLVDAMKRPFYSYCHMISQFWNDDLWDGRLLAMLFVLLTLCFSLAVATGSIAAVVSLVCDGHWKILIALILLPSALYSLTKWIAGIGEVRKFGILGILFASCIALSAVCDNPNNCNNWEFQCVMNKDANPAELLELESKLKSEGYTRIRFRFERKDDFAGRPIVGVKVYATRSQPTADSRH